MKKRFSLVIALVMLLCLSIPVLAASETYRVEELDLQVDIPSEYLVITRDTSATDSIFSLLNNVTYESVMKQFQDGNIYLNAITFERSEEIVVTMTEIALADFSSIDDTILNTLAAALPNQYASYGIEVIKQDLYSHSQTKFIRLYFYDTNSQVYGLQYYTVYGGKAMNFTMRSSEGSLLAVQEQNIKDVVDSIQFGLAPVATEPEISQTVPSEPEITQTVPSEPEISQTLPATSEPSAAEATTVGSTAAAVNGAAGTQMTVNSQANTSDDSLMLWILIGVGVAAVVVIVLLIVLLRRKKKAPAPAPVATAPGAPMPGAQIPVEQVPVSQIPVSQIPVEQVPMSQIPVSQIPVEQVPMSQIPVSQIPVEQQYQPDPVYPTAFCPHCGTALQPGAQFCTVCGCQFTNQ